MLGSLVMTGVATAEEVETKEVNIQTSANTSASVANSETPVENSKEVTYAAPALSSAVSEDTKDSVTATEGASQTEEETATKKTVTRVEKDDKSEEKTENASESTKKNKTADESDRTESEKSAVVEKSAVTGESSETPSTASKEETKTPENSAERTSAKLPDHELTKEEAEAILARNQANFAAETKAVNELKANKVAHDALAAKQLQTEATNAYASELGKRRSSAMPRDPRNGQAIPTGTGFRADTSSNKLAITGIQAGLTDANPNTTESIPDFTPRTKLEYINKQLAWLDFNDNNAWKGRDKNGFLQVGAVYEKEIMPGYVVKLEVKELKPFQATDIYRQRVLNDPTATDGAKNFYDPNATNQNFDGNAAAARVKAYPNNGWSELVKSGIQVGNKHVFIRSDGNGVNWGAVFGVSATFNGKPVAANVVMTDGESANAGEYAIYTTNGSGWQVVAEFQKGNSGHYRVQTEKSQYGSDPGPSGNIYALQAAGNKLNPGFSDSIKYWMSPDEKTGGLGSQVFGPVFSANYSVPILMSQNASEVGMYIISKGQQAGMIGFLITDLGDAPDSYGDAVHTIVSVDQRDGSVINHPFLGDTPADPDIKQKNGTPWFTDDQTGVKDEDIDQLLPNSEKYVTNGIIKANRTDEGYYTLTVKASANGNKAAYIKAWADINNNGKFDAEEESETLEVGEQGYYTIRFLNISPQNDDEFSKSGFRVRIALSPDEIEGPTGFAFSGEVEDFQAQLTYPPRGDKQETTGAQGTTQNATVHFKAYGVAAFDYSKRAKINQTIPAKIVLADGKDAPLDASGYYIVEGEGKYKITDAGDDVSVEFIPEPTFVGVAKGISIRRTDTNGATTGWFSKDKDKEGGLAAISDQTGRMDGRYIPTVVPLTPIGKDAFSQGIQGKTQKGKPEFEPGREDLLVKITAEQPVRFIDATTGKATSDTTIPAMKDGVQVGTYSLEPLTGVVTFVPNKDFVGTPDAAVVEVRDINGVPGTAKYTPTVMPVNPKTQAAVTTGPQGATQTGYPSITEGNPEVPIKEGSFTILDDSGNKVATLPAKNPAGKVVGTYTIDANTGAVTFTPSDKTYTGEVASVTVQAEDVNGTKASTTYTPYILPVQPSAEAATSTGPQGASQTGTPTFKSGNQEVAPIKTGSITLLDDKGTAVDSLDAKDPSGNVIGRYTVNKDTGVVTFTPTIKTYTGIVVPANVQAEDTNGTKVSTIYTPHIIPVVPTATPAETTGPQGADQIGKPTFKSGNETVAPISQGSMILVDDNGDLISTIDAKDPSGKVVGSYTLFGDSIVFSPTDKSYTGTVLPVKVQAADTNGTTVTTTYTPHIVPVKPTAEPASSTGYQGANQTGTPTFKSGNETVAPIKKGSLTLLDDQGQAVDTADAKDSSGNVIGQYSINKTTGEVTFTPTVKTYSGEVTPVNVQAEDTNGTKVATTYTPHIIPVVPTATAAETVGPQGANQTGKPTFTSGNDQVAPIKENSFKLVNDKSEVVESLDAKDPFGNVVGSYTIDSSTGSVTFTPTNKAYTGPVQPVTVQAEDTNGTKVTTTYKATVTPVTPTGKDVTSIDIQGKTQTGKPEFKEGDPVAPIDPKVAPTFDDGSKEKVVSGQGTYTIDGDGVVTFKPEPQFTGVATTVTVKRQDTNGTVVTATYTPTVTEVKPTAQPASTTGKQGAEQSGKPIFTPGHADVPMKENSVKLLDENGQAVNTVDAKTADGKVVGTYTVDSSTGLVTFKPSDKTYTGPVEPVKVQAEDKNGTKVSTTYKATITPVTPTGQNVTSSDIQGKTQTGTPVFTSGDETVAPIDKAVAPTFEDGSKEQVIKGQGTYTIDENGTVTFKPEPQFTGVATTVTVKRQDTNGTVVTATYTPTVTEVTPTAQPASTTGLQGAIQSGTPAFTPGHADVPMKADAIKLLDATGQPVNSVPAKTADGKEVGTYTVDPTTGTVTFTPTDKTYTGPVAPVEVQSEDINGTKVKTTYQVTITPVKPTGQNVTSTDIQGKVQTGTPTFTSGDEAVAPIDKAVAPTFEDGSNEKVIKGQGTYTIDGNGTVTFTPEPQFTGTATTVTVKRQDTNGTVVTATYTPTVTPVTPTAQAASTTGKQGAEQSGKPIFTPGHADVPMKENSVKLLDENGQAVNTLDAKSADGKVVGTYTVDPSTGIVTFKPTDKTYTGPVEPVTVQAEDENGTKVSTTYKATITPVTPTGQNVTSSDIQGKTQTGTPTFTSGDETVAPIDKAVAPTFADGSKEIVIKDQGTYTIDVDGVVTFKPEPQFTGVATTVTVKRQDTNGTVVTATYTPTVTPVTPTAQPASTTGKQGATQSGTPTFTAGNDEVPMKENAVKLLDTNGNEVTSVPAKTADGREVGTYTVDPATGTVTFTPTDKTYTGPVAPVDVQSEDINGTKVKTTYQVTITPVTPTGKDVSSTGLQGKEQTGKPEFTPGDATVAPIDPNVKPTFEDGQTTKTVDGQGTYTIAEDGTVTFKPEPQFKGVADGVTVIRKDTNGTVAKAKYTPTVTAVTPTAQAASTTGLQGATQSGTPTFTAGNDEVPMKENAVKLLDTNGNEVTSVPAKTADGKEVGTYTVDSTTGTVTFTPTDKTYTGPVAPVEVQSEDVNGTKVKTTYQVTITPVKPTGKDVTSTGIQGKAQTGKPEFTPGDAVVAPIDENVKPTFEDGQTTKTVDGQGTYTIAEDGTVTFTPEPQFTGTAKPVTVKRQDTNGTVVTATYTPTVTAVTPTAQPASTTGKQGADQSGTPSFTPGNDAVPMKENAVTLLDDNGQPTNSVEAKTKDGKVVGTYTVDSATGTVTFTPTDKTYTGPVAPVDVQSEDINGTKVKTTYQVTITPVTPIGKDVTSNGLQGKVQTGKPTFTPGDPVAPIDETVKPTFDDGQTTKTVDGQGTYTIAEDGTVTFTPEPQFKGTATPVTVVRKDTNGTKVTATYTPTVTPVTPTAQPAATTGKQGATQTGTPTFTPGDKDVPMKAGAVKLLDASGNEVTSLPAKTADGREVGTYTVDSNTGEVTFTPTDKTYTGEVAPVTVQSEDVNGTKVSTTYKVTITPVTPTGQNVTSTDIQGKTQTGKPVFISGDEDVAPIDTKVAPTFDDGTKEKVVSGQGTYTIAEDGTVTFTPEPQFTGKATTVTVKRQDTNGTEVTATYTPTVTAVTPTAQADASTGKQGATQTGQPTFTPGHADVPMKEGAVTLLDESGAPSKSVPAKATDGKVVGTYTIDSSTGIITYTPTDKTYTGTVQPVAVQSEDMNGTTVKTTYGVTITPVKPTGQDVTSSDIQGKAQTGKPVFTAGDPVAPIDDTVKPTFEDGSTSKTVSGQGTYTIAEDGTVTFTPEKQFTGQATGVTVVRKDTNGTEARATYTPTVVAVTPTGKSVGDADREIGV